MATDKNVRYDRQLRLWGEDGQARLEGTRACLIGAGATGSETLKNLVLPGVGSVTIVDDAKVSAADLGNNFFVDATALGTSRAKRVSELLTEMNEFVPGKFVDRSATELVEKNIEFFKEFTIVIVTQLGEAALRKLAAYCWEQGIVLVVARSYGLVGLLRVVTPEITIVDSKPDNPVIDLRLATPFAALEAFVDGFELDNAAKWADPALKAKHSHIPYPALLLHGLRKFRAEHGGRLPGNTAERKRFHELVAATRLDAEEENYGEAQRAAFHACVAAAVPAEVQRILQDDKARLVTAASPNFWLLAAALREFVDNEGGGALPVIGSLPDMRAETDTYIQLQTLYQDKAAADVAAVSRRLAAILERVGRPAGSIAADEIKMFCRHAHDLRLRRYASLDAELTLSDDAIKQEIRAALADDMRHLPALYYLLFRAADRFHALHNRYPGARDDEVEADLPLLKKLVLDLARDIGGVDPAAIIDDHVHEMCRFGAAEVHNVAAFMGGVASQEVLKLITRKFVPMRSVFIYNGIHSTTGVLAL